MVGSMMDPSFDHWIHGGTMHGSMMDPWYGSMVESMAVPCRDPWRIHRWIHDGSIVGFIVESMAVRTMHPWSIHRWIHGSSLIEFFDWHFQNVYFGFGRSENVESGIQFSSRLDFVNMFIAVELPRPRVIETCFRCLFDVATAPDLGLFCVGFMVHVQHDKEWKRVHRNNRTPRNRPKSPPVGFGAILVRCGISAYRVPVKRRSIPYFVAFSTLHNATRRGDYINTLPVCSAGGRIIMWWIEFKGHVIMLKSTILLSWVWPEPMNLYKNKYL